MAVQIITEIDQDDIVTVLQLKSNQIKSSNRQSRPKLQADREPENTEQYRMKIHMQT